MRHLDRHHAADSEYTNAAENIPETASTETKKIPPKILYHYINKDFEGNITENKESSHPITNIETGGAAKTLTDETILEVLSTKKTNIYYPSSLTTELKIYSLPLINVLRDVVQYWPGVSLWTHPVRIEEPYAALVHHLDAIEKYKNNHPASHSPEYKDLCNEHIDVLLSFLEERWGETLRQERQRYQKSPPMATFENLWMLFKPGQDAYIKAREDKPAIPLTIGSITDANIDGWGVICNGTRIARQRRQGSISRFDGEKEILSLEVYPKQFHNSAGYEQELQKRGERYWAFCEPTYGQYDGNTIAQQGEPRMKVCTCQVQQDQSSKCFISSLTTSRSSMAASSLILVLTISTWEISTKMILVLTLLRVFHLYGRQYHLPKDASVHFVAY